MSSPLGVTRVVLVVLDGLRADALPLLRLPHLAALARHGCGTVSARTVQPSITAAAMTSLFTGVAPAVHGIRSDRFGLPNATEPLTPLPSLLRDHGIPVRAFMHAIPRAYRGIAARVADHIGAEVTMQGESATEILAAARPGLERPGMHFLHWPDADRAGHATGWMSRAYQQAARDMDEALGVLLRESDALCDPATVLIAMADHGGGGVDGRDHDSDHPLDTTIPIFIGGGRVRRDRLGPGVSLLDVPATLTWIFGVPTPANYAGRILLEAFAVPRTRQPSPAALLPAA